MNTGPADRLLDAELDALWTIYEGYSLLIERPAKNGLEPSVHAVMSVAYDGDEAVAEVAEIDMEAAQALIEKGYLDPSEDGPVLSEDTWFDEELGCEVYAEEYVLSELGEAAIRDTADPDAEEGDEEDEHAGHVHAGGWDEDEDVEPWGDGPEDEEGDDDDELEDGYDDEDDEDEDDDEIRAD